MTRTVRLAAVLALLLPAAHAAAIRLIERNGDQITGRDLVSLRITHDGIVVVLPDVIFAARFEQ